jgi:hypothetical protein
MIVRFAVALEISTDERLQPKRGKPAPPQKASRKVLRRLQQIESLPAYNKVLC